MRDEVARASLRYRLAVFGGLFVYLSNLVDGPAVLLFALMFIICLLSSLFLFLLSKVLK